MDRVALCQSRQAEITTNLNLGTPNNLEVSGLHSFKIVLKTSINTTVPVAAWVICIFKQCDNHKHVNVSIVLELGCSGSRRNDIGFWDPLSWGHADSFKGFSPKGTFGIR